MMVEHTFRVAGFLFTVILPAGAGALLPTFAPFACNGDGGGCRLFDFTAYPYAGVPSVDGARLLEVSENDMGLMRLYGTGGGYRVDLVSGGTVGSLLADSCFTSVRAYVSWADKGVGPVLSSLLRIAYSQAVLLHDAVSIHASAVYCGGRAYMFMGKSGTGKSTHASLWLQHIPGSGLLNDDNPTIRITGGRAIVSGTPWSGKTHCYKNLSFPVGGMVRLRQAPANSFTPQSDVDAFVTIYPGCSVINQDLRLRNSLYSTLSRLAGLVPVGTLCCRPDAEAARLCYSELVSR